MRPEVNMKFFHYVIAFTLAISGWGAQAAIWKCFKDPATCPTGDHTRCVGYGWCGPDCDVCRVSPTDLDPPKTSCEDCFSLPIASDSCVRECGCPPKSAFCGSW